MEPSIKRCTLALIMCGISAIGMAQEVLLKQDFSNFTINQDWTSNSPKSVEGWSILLCSVQNTNLFPQSLYFNYKDNNNIKGYAKTPTLNYDGDIILSFNSAKSQDHNANLSISIEGGASSESLTISNHINSGWKNNTYIFEVSSSSRIKFGLETYYHFVLDDVVVVKDILCDNADNQYYLTAHNDKETVVHTKRTLTGGIWNTLCLPFNVTKATMEAALGQDVQLRTYTGFAGNVMTFSEVTGDDVITAGTPFLLKLNTTVTNPTFNSVTVSNSTAAQTVTRGDVSFIGTYSKKELATDGTELFITTSGGLAIPTATGNVMNGMRAYIKVPESMKFTPNGVRLAIDNETTSIQSVTTTSQPDAVYNLSGQRLQQPRKGLNIIRKNGKLIFIR